MTASPDVAETRSENRLQARALAEQALHAQARGRDDEADRLFAEAHAIDPSAVAEVLEEHDAAVPPDARDRATADRDAEHARRQFEPGSTGPRKGSPSGETTP